MSLHDDMAAAHSRDYAEERAMRDLKGQIDGFLAAPPSRCDPNTQETLRAALDGLWRDCLRIQRVWE